MRGERHNPEIKAAVLAALLTGQGVEFVAKTFGLSPNTVKTWKKGSKHLTFKGDVHPQKRDDLVKGEGEPVGEVSGELAIDDGVDVYSRLVGEYLRENLTTLAAQQKFFRDPDWLKRQSASDLAVLHGVAADKAIRLLEAAEAANPNVV